MQSMRKRSNISIFRLAGVLTALLLQVLIPTLSQACADNMAAVDTVAVTEIVIVDATTYNASENASEVFMNLPVDVLDILPEDVRFRMITYWENDSVYPAVNAMGGISLLNNVTPDFLEVEVTDVSLFQLRLLPTRKNDEKIVMTVYTVGSESQSPDSDVRFFSMDMKELPRNRFFKQPRIKDFFKVDKDSPLTIKEIEQKIPFPAIEYSASAADTGLTARLTVGVYMNEDDYKEVKPFEKPSLIYEWDGKRFRLRK